MNLMVTFKLNGLEEALSLVRAFNVLVDVPYHTEGVTNAALAVVASHLNGTPIIAVEVFAPAAPEGVKG